MVDAFIQAGSACGYCENPDYNGARQDGFGYYQVTQRDGRRESAADAYLHPVKSRPNLDIQLEAHVERIVLENHVARGVVYRQTGATRTAQASRAVIVSAGAVQSPQILELSGIAAPQVLQPHGIPVLHALVGVGENYRDHYAARLNWRVNQPITLNQQTRGLRIVRETLRYALFRRGILTLTAGIGHGFVRSRPELQTPDCQFFFAHASFGDANPRALDTEPDMTIGVYQCRPESRGSIHVAFSDPFDKPHIQATFLSDPLDQSTLVAGMRIARQVGETAPLSDYVEHDMNPGSDKRHSDELLDYTRNTCATTYHVMGTCKMGPEHDSMAVVDNSLKVRGLEQLCVIDASVMPTMPSGNINAPVIMIAEKAADLLLKSAS